MWTTNVFSAHFQGLKICKTTTDRVLREILRKALSALPTPKNEYEIVVNEEDIDEGVTECCHSVSDQADDDAKRELDRIEAIIAEGRYVLSARPQ